MRRGRPLWFLGSVLAGWTALRVTMLWPSAAPVRIVDVASAAAEPATTKAPPVARVVQALPPARPFLPAIARASSSSPGTGETSAASASVGGDDGGAVDRTVLRPRPDIAAPPQSSAALAVRLETVPVAPAAAARSRLTVDAWLVARPGGGGDSLAFGQLGASQGGARVTYALDGEHRIAVSARLSAPFQGRGSEAGMGLDLRPTRLPVHLLVEGRAPLDGGPARPAAELFGGVSAGLPGRLRLDAYAQGGAVLKRGGFADGAALVVRPLAARGGVRLEAGAGVWGAAQRGAARLDVGPTLALAVPAGGAGLRLGVDYRLRATGRARPGSGPALTLGTSF
ncbi:hypothetical protein [uncultured Sphingomonas sp.]|uniref:hypothetical protein n=1 Tax=uncultured Sphingomonas sp. TaxID=158754 RepID=UPI0035CB0238